jgi:hypothetical protein
MEDDKKCGMGLFLKIQFQLYFGWVVQTKT